MKKIVVIGGGNAGLSTALLLALASHSVEAVRVEPQPMKFKAYDRRHMLDKVVIKKPKKPNFSRFQNNFKPRGKKK